MGSEWTSGLGFCVGAGVGAGVGACVTFGAGIASFAGINLDDHWLPLSGPLYLKPPVECQLMGASDSIGI